MAQTGKHSVIDGVAVMVLHHPPVNALTPDIILALDAQLTQALDDRAVSEILLVGEGRVFCSGTEIAEFNHDADAAPLADLCLRLEDSPKPVVVALHGLALGQGLELAMAAHYCVAHPATQVGLPEVKLGLVPGSGGSQRLPRLVGPKAALDLLLSGASRSVRDVALTGLIDRLHDAAPLKAGQAFCRSLRDAGHRPRPTRDRREALAGFQAYQQEFVRRRAQIEGQPETAPAEIVNCVEAAALLPFEAGMEYERAAHEASVLSDQSRALRHAFFAERRISQSAKPQAEGLTVDTVAVLGAGGPAAQIAAALLLAGLRVDWGVQESRLLDDCHTRLRQTLDQTIAAGRLDTAGRDKALERVSQGLSAEMVNRAGIVLHAARGQGAVPVPDRTPRLVCFAGAVDQVGLRFTPPITLNRLVEVVEGPHATDAQLDAAFLLGQKLNRLAVHTVSGGMTIAERMLAACHRAADALVDSGLSPYEVDAAMLSWGWRRPPFQLRDLLGLEPTASLVRAKGAHNWTSVIMATGRRGRGQGGGFYDYPTGHGPKPSRAVLAAVDAVRPAHRSVSKAVAQTLIVAAMANEGARILADGWAAYPSDIDVVCMYAMDFPRWRGGPMMAADQMGLFTTVRAMSAFDHPDDGFWDPNKLINDLVKNGRGFGSLNG